MQRWRERQRAFARALFAGVAGDAEGPTVPPPGVVGPDARPCTRRFDVYRNNVLAGLIETLRGGYPAIRRLIGEACFTELARRYALAHPPRSPVMALYGGGLARYIAHLPDTAALPYLADVARIERAWTEAYHAAEAAVLEPAALAGLSPGRVAGLRFVPHPSLRLVCSRHPALTIWRMNVADGEPRPLDLGVAEDALIVRPESEVEVRSLPAGGAPFLRALARGRPLGQAAAAARRRAARFDLAAHLAGLLDSRVFAGIVEEGCIDGAAA